LILLLTTQAEALGQHAHLAGWIRMPMATSLAVFSRCLRIAWRRRGVLRSGRLSGERQAGTKKCAERKRGYTSVHGYFFLLEIFSLHPHRRLLHQLV
jgi:hypothetical protein